MKFNPRAYYDSLNPQQQLALGVAALLLIAAHEAQPLLLDAKAPAYSRWAHAHDEAWPLVDAVKPAIAPYLQDGPDLAAIGIRACRHCGCTDASSCPGGCSWAEPDLCTRCLAHAGDEPAARPAG